MRVIYIGTKYNERGTALRDVHPDEIVMIVDMDRCMELVVSAVRPNMVMPSLLLYGA